MLIAVAALAALSFNLVCTGTEISGLAEGTLIQSERRENFTAIYRVDLETERWCVDSCEQTAPIAKVQEHTLTFEDKTIEAWNGFTNSTVNRESGAYTRMDKANRFIDYRMGKCERTAFTGFPALKF